MKRPWIKFYPSDWLGDSQLSRCSLAAQGLWMRLICVMAQQPDPGVLADARGAWDDETILRSCGLSTDPGLEILLELRTGGVLSKNQTGAIFSRRLVREAHSRERAVDRQHTHRARDADLSVTRDNSVTGASPEARYQNKSQKPLASAASAAQNPLRSEEEQRRIVAQRDARVRKESELFADAQIGAGPSQADQMPARPGSALDIARRKFAGKSNNCSTSRP